MFDIGLNVEGLCKLFLQSISFEGLHNLTVFILACFVGYYVVWRVTPALHAPLMSVTNAISSVIVIGGLFVSFEGDLSYSQICGLFAIFLASVNIFGGFTVTHRMLKMFQKNNRS
ncbi:MAG: NAD(P) transhydrogenase subunit alpha part 2 [Alphaproteobacteria bacterium]|nr:NAD(P) transhydrogenase subunit alpha part 2 [Alphaproteobacteria bacterium]